MPRPRSQRFLFVASNSYPAPQLEWFDANTNVVGPSAQCFGIHLLSHSRMGLSQDLGTTKNHMVIIPFPLKSLKIWPNIGVSRRYPPFPDIRQEPKTFGSYQKSSSHLVDWDPIGVCQWILKGLVILGIKIH
jgi:hypothetical protein